MSMGIDRVPSGDAAWHAGESWLEIRRSLNDKPIEIFFAYHISFDTSVRLLGNWDLAEGLDGPR